MNKEMSIKSRLNILCVEDDLIVANYISSLLDKSKYRVKNINDGKKAFDFLVARSEPIDIVLLDYHLPSMDGIQILQKLKEAKVIYPVIFLTVDETLDTAIRAMKEGAIDYLPKSSFLKAELNIKLERAYGLYYERKKAELHEEQISILTMAVDQSPNSFIITDKSGNIEYVNKKFTQYTGYSFEEVKGKNPRIIQTDSYAPGFYEKLWNTIISGKIWKGEFVNRKKNGEIFYNRASIAPVKSKTGEIVSFIGINEDITELKAIEAQLLLKNNEMDRFFSVVINLLCIIDNSTRKFVRLNDAWFDLLGFTPEELQATSFMDFVHQDDQESTERAFKFLVENGRLKNFVNRFKCKNGDYKFVEWSAIRNDNVTSYGSATDITDRIKNENALKESEKKFRTMFEMTSAGIFYTDNNLKIILANTAFTSILGCSFENIHLKNFTQFTHWEDIEKENILLNKLINAEITEYEIEKRFIGEQNQIGWVDVSMTSIRHEDGTLLYLVGVVSNIELRKQYEETLKSSNKVKDKFFSIISHDLRSHFSGIEGLSEILLIKGVDVKPETRERYLKLLYNGGKSALNLLENLLAWSKVQINNMEYNPIVLNISSVVGEVLDSVENQAAIKGISLINEIDTGQRIVADENMIKTVIRNLLNNAIKFTPVNGEVKIRSWQTNARDFISVKDTGVGLDSQKKANLFNYEAIKSSIGTESEKGSGLGLILCSEFIGIHKGAIDVISEPGVGSEFIISLPALSHPSR